VVKKASILFFICLLFINSYALQSNAHRLPAALSLEVEALPRTDDMEMHLKLTNISDHLNKLRFSSSQKYEIVIKSFDGKEVYRYSLNKTFTQAVQEMTLNPLESIEWKETWDYKNNGQRVEAGDYQVEAEVLQMALTNPKEPITAKAALSVPEENQIFKNIKVQGSKGIYKITGYAHTKNKLLYTVEDGHKELISNQVVEKEKNNTFTIHVDIPEQNLPKNGTLILYLIEEAANYDKPYPIELESFQP